MMTSHEYDGQTIIGTFSDKWDGDSAFEDLKFAGFDGRVRYVHRKVEGVPDDTKSYGGFPTYFAEMHGFESEEDYKDSRDTFSVNPEAEDYFLEAFDNCLHVILIQALDDAEKAIEIIRIHHGRVEVKPWVFFARASEEESLVPTKIEGMPIPPKMSEIAPPR